MTHRCFTIPAHYGWPKSLRAESDLPTPPHAPALTSAYLTPMTSPASPDAQSRKPVILSVDDDPAVSRAVARDLRRHYGETHRIVRAESGPDALETLKQLKLRGETVAMLVADYRMPQMTGIEFLERAMDLYPAARRVLLTAYADTHAAIDAINVVDLDHYLLKPWDPPEE
jgi:thioredoxin reductase (NADPH)